MDTIDIEISDNQQVVDIEAHQLRTTVAHVLKHLSVSQGVVSLAVVDDDTISQIKARYYHCLEVTDVLSFDLRDHPGAACAEPVLDCEIVVNAQRALQEARARGTDPRAELNLYVVHGLLHQLGFDDQTAGEAQLMHQKEDQILQELGFGKVYHPNQNNGGKR